MGEETESSSSKTMESSRSENWKDCSFCDATGWKKKQPRHSDWKGYKHQPSWAGYSVTSDWSDYKTHQSHNEKPCPSDKDCGGDCPSDKNCEEMRCDACGGDGHVFVGAKRVYEA